MALVLMVPLQVLAHKINVFAAVVGGTVQVEGYFPDGRAAENSAVEVYNLAGQMLYQGKTDKKGLWIFSPERPEALKIVISASLGHRNEYLLSLNEWFEESVEEGGEPLDQNRLEQAIVHPAPKEPIPWLSLLTGLGLLLGLSLLAKRLRT